MIKVAARGCVDIERRIAFDDPFQLATPCWRKNTVSQLPPEVINTIVQSSIPVKRIAPYTKENNMPITKVQANTVPAKRAQGGGGSPIAEIAEVMDALKTLKPNEAIRVTLSKETTERLSTKKNGNKKIPARVLIATLRKKFSSQGLGYTAYTVDDKEIIVVKTSKKAEGSAG